MVLSLNLGLAGFSSSDRFKKVSTSNLRCLEEEMKKIEPFRRELPLCMILLETTVERFRKGPRNGMFRGSSHGHTFDRVAVPIEEKVQ